MSKIIGQVLQKQELQTFNEGKQNEFKKQILIVETIETKTPFPVEFTNKNIDLLNDVLLGQNVMIDYRFNNNFSEDRKTVYVSLIAKTLTIIN